MALLDQSVSAGTLDKQIVLQTLSLTSDGGGGQNETWSDGATMWSSIAPGSGREFFAAQEQQPELSHVVTIRYRTGVTPKMRLKYVLNGVPRTFVIHVVSSPAERHESLVLMCSEITQT